jgi:HK97 family phage prohead protease
MPEPGKNEKKKDFIDRCIPIVIADGTAKDGAQANAICHSIWDESKKKKEKKSEEDSMYIKIDEMERRCLPTAELRLSEDDKSPKITGYAAVFNTWADIGGWFRESVRPGAFTKTIGENDIRALLNHDPNFVLGRNKANTLKLREDSKGLAVEIDPVPSTWANDLLTSIRRGDVNQMSFGFNVNKQEVDYEKDERILIDVTLFDVSVVTFAAYPQTSAQVRSLFAEKREEKTLKWKKFDELIEKIKSGEALTPDEQREMMIYLPELSVPPAKQTETSPEPPAKHSDPETSKGKDRISQLLIRAEVIAPSSN